MNEITWTNGQKEGLSKMIDWTKMKGFDSTFTLAGSAGTGKSTVTGEFIKQCGISRNSIAVSAPTHKAKNVISGFTKLPGHTLQGLLGLRPDVDLADFDHNNPAYKILAEPQISNYKLVIIDECSMVNEDLHETLTKQSKIYNVKLLYLGDKKQLPPISEKLSTTFTQCDYSHTLTEIVRQNKDNPLINLLDVICKDIDNDTNYYVKHLLQETEDFNSKGEGYLITRNDDDFAEYMERAVLSPKYSNDVNYFKFLGWTNFSAEYYNTICRNAIFKTDKIVTAGDLLMAYRTLADRSGSLILENGQDYITKSTKEIYSSVAKANTYKVDLFDIDYQTIENLVIIDDKNITDFREVLKGKLKYAQEKRAWKQWYEFKNQYLLNSDLYDVNEHGIVVKSKDTLLSKRDLGYGYGCTVHKSQGSTYENVFISGRDIVKNRDNMERKKLLYVALSRAKTKAFIKM